MPRKTKPTALADQAAQPQFHIPAELLDQLVTGPMTPGQVQGLFDQFKKSILERALGAELAAQREDVRDAQIDVGRRAQPAADEHGAHAQALGRAQVDR